MPGPFSCAQMPAASHMRVHIVNSQACALAY